MKPVDVQDPSIDRLRDSYTDVPYWSQAYSESHPDRLAVLGRIFGMRPTPITKCRVLELGCASGGNIIPMAYFLPESEFVGVELTEGHVKAGIKTVTDLGLKNIRIEHGNILDVNPSWGQFDFIICHGVFSWVPTAVQEKILSVLFENLTEQGIGYVSYNTYPGWHMREMIRHMMLYHAKQFETPKQRLAQARALIEFLGKAVANNTQDPYGLLVKNELESLKKSEDWYVFHDLMEVVNTPIYFHQFIELADKAGLQYLAEAAFHMMFNSGFPEEINQTLESVSQDIVQKEQYMDFLRNRQFRHTLLCRKELELNRTLDADSLAGLLVVSAISSEKEGAVDLSPGVNEKFRIAEATIEIQNSVLKASLPILKRRWPEATQFESLLEMALSDMKDKLDPDIINGTDWRRELGRGLLHCYASGAIELRTWQGDFARSVSETPKINRLAGYQVSNQLGVVNQSLEIVGLDTLAEHLIPLLDGTRDRAELVSSLTQLAVDKRFTLTQYNLPITDPERMYHYIDESIDTVLSKLSEAQLLVG